MNQILCKLFFAQQEEKVRKILFEGEGKRKRENKKKKTIFIWDSFEEF